MNIENFKPHPYSNFNSSMVRLKAAYIDIKMKGLIVFQFQYGAIEGRRD